MLGQSQSSLDLKVEQACLHFPDHNLLSGLILDHWVFLRSLLALPSLQIQDLWAHCLLKRLIKGSGCLLLLLRWRYYPISSSFVSWVLSSLVGCNWSQFAASILIIRVMRWPERFELLKDGFSVSFWLY